MLRVVRERILSFTGEQREAYQTFLKMRFLLAQCDMAVVKACMGQAVTVGINYERLLSYSF